MRERTRNDTENNVRSAARSTLTGSNIKPALQLKDNRPSAAAHERIQHVVCESARNRRMSLPQNTRSIAPRGYAEPTQLLLAADPVDELRTRCLRYEADFETQTNRLPERFRWPDNDHPTVETARAQLALARAPLGIDNRADIERELDGVEKYLSELTNDINQHLAGLEKIAPVLQQFAEALGGDFNPDLDDLRTSLYEGRFSVPKYNLVARRIYNRVEINNKGMQALRKNNAGEASALVRRYVHAGMITVGQINTYYCSPFDNPQDRFGAKASVSASGSGAMQWVREWEFHIHGEVIRAGGADTPATSFRIARGHIKPTAKKMETGVSIEIADPGVIGAITNSSMDQVLRWANSARAKSVLAKQ